MGSRSRSTIVVFTRDLRTLDNPALAAACADADAVVPLFVIDPAITNSAGANRLGFLDDSLRDLDRSLRDLGARLVLRRGDWIEEVLRTARAVDARSIHLAADVSDLAQRRVGRLRRLAAEARMEVHEHPGVTIVPPGQLRPSGGGEYKVFTPYYRRWTATRWRDVVGAPRRITLPPDPPSSPFAGVEVLDRMPSGQRSPDVLTGGERAAVRRLRQFAATMDDTTPDRREVLADDATSRLSAFLHFGCASPLGVAARLGGEPGGDAVVRQLCWRDFFHQVLAARPDAARADYRPDGRQWNDDPDAYAAWRDGRTGYPLVDAAMRQLATEGFMHNRARMVVASFLCKDLQLDWRLGAAHFMSLLADGDVANNQLNWQWVAGTGSDTNPNRIFNPVTQGRRHDPHGDYIRRYLPELAGLGTDEVHWPEPSTRDRLRYPMPIVDHHEAIAAYRARARSARPAR